MRFGTLSSCAVLASLLACNAPSFGAIQVGSADALFYDGFITQMKLTNFEIANNESGGDPDVLEPGDTLRGIFTITSTANDSDPGNTNIQRVPNGFELTGLFQTQVRSVTTLFPGSEYITFEPYTPFATELAGITGRPVADFAGAMVAFFEDTTPDFSSATVAGGEASATDGSFWRAIGGTGTWGTDYYWDAFGPADTTAILFTTVFAASLQEIAIGSSNIAFDDSILQNPSTGGSATLGLISNAWGLQGNVTRNPSFPASEYPLRSQDPLRSDKIVPEPTTLVVWGLLVSLGLAGATTRRLA